MISVMSYQLNGGFKMKFNHYHEVLESYGFRELGYFSGLQTFLGNDILITIEECHGGFQITIDSVARNIGDVFYCASDLILCELLEDYL